LVRVQPFRSNLPIEIPITLRAQFQTRSQRVGALKGNEVLNGLVDEPAALAPAGHPGDGPKRGLRQDDVDAPGHGEGIGDPASTSYTQLMWKSMWSLIPAP
jgi:hypothetical protein